MHKTITVLCTSDTAAQTTAKLGTNFGAVRTLKAGIFHFFFFRSVPTMWSCPVDLSRVVSQARLESLARETNPEADRQVSRPGGWRHEIIHCTMR